MSELLLHLDIAKVEAQAELDKLGHSLAYEHASSAIESASVMHEDGSWQICDRETANVAEDLRYLEMRGLIERVDGAPHRFHIRDENEGTSCGS